MIQNRMKLAARRSGCHRAGVHILRHTFCSHLAMRGAAPRAIQEVAGHQDLGTTQRYLHLTPAAAQGVIRLLDQSAPDFGSGRGDCGEAARPAASKANG
jgi:site-specific recombinase XerD